jgi:hypothetical protein
VLSSNSVSRTSEYRSHKQGKFRSDQAITKRTLLFDCLHFLGCVSTSTGCLVLELHIWYIKHDTYERCKVRPGRAITKDTLLLEYCSFLLHKLHVWYDKHTTYKRCEWCSGGAKLSSLYSWNIIIFLALSHLPLEVCYVEHTRYKRY